MNEQISIDKKFATPLQSIKSAIEMQEVPLLVISEQDQWAFTSLVIKLFGGTVIYSSAEDASQLILSDITKQDYLFLVIEESLERFKEKPPKKNLDKFIRYYLQSRDTYGIEDTFLKKEFEENPIHANHRLILLIDHNILGQQPEHVRRYLIEQATRIVIS